MFTAEMLSGIEWQQIVPMQTPQRCYRVTAEWALDRYRVRVFDLASNHQVRVNSAYYLRTAVALANRRLREFTKKEPKGTI